MENVMSDTDNNEEQTSKKPASEPQAETKPAKAAKDPVRKWTFIILAMALLLLAWYLVSDRLAPFTSQARVHALVVPIAPEVSGTVASVSVKNNQRVKAGQELFHIDPVRYRLAVQAAEADLQTARQSMGASSANVTAAEAALVSAQASYSQAEKDASRFQKIKEEDPGAVSQRRIDSSVAALEAARGQVESARANIEKAIQDLGQTGEQNSRILQAQSALAQAQVNYERTVLRAPEDGLVTDVRVAKGNYANTSAPQMTFVALDNIWVRADFTENNLGNIKPGDKVKIVFDVLPGKVFPGTVRELGFGVQIDSAPLGSLPTIENDQGWLRATQRYPVLVDFGLQSREDLSGLRVGSQASVVVFTGDNSFINLLAGFQIWLNSILTYAY
jgi:multidrug resistance efflux pump